MKKRFLIMSLVALVFVACSDEDVALNSSDNPRKSIDMTSSFEELSKSTSDFAFDMFSTMSETIGEGDTPLLLSPMSASFVLGMMGNGAAGTTREETMSALGWKNKDISEMNNYYHTLISELPSLDKTSTIKIANSQWTNPSYSLLSDYSQTIKDCFSAELETLNLSSAVNDINNWCKENTEGLISDFFSQGEISSATQTILLNALYFKGEWKDKFDKNKTHSGEFANYDGTTSTVSYMSGTHTTTIYEGDSYSVLTLDFGNEAYSMQILLPNEDVSLSECVASLNTTTWLGWTTDYSRVMAYDVDVLLPKFSVNYKRELTDIFENMGIKSAFNAGDFSNMSESSIALNDIKQATVFSIDEDGAKAASATGNGSIVANPMEQREFHVTRPFIYTLVENSSHTILFIGRITKL